MLAHYDSFAFFIVIPSTSTQSRLHLLLCPLPLLLWVLLLFNHWQCNSCSCIQELLNFLFLAPYWWKEWAGTLMMHVLLNVHRNIKKKRLLEARWKDFFTAGLQLSFKENLARLGICKNLNMQINYERYTFELDNFAKGSEVTWNLLLASQLPDISCCVTTP